MIADDLDTLVLALIESADSPRRVLAVAGQIAVLAHRLHQQEVEAIPPHLRNPEPVLRPSVARLPAGRARQ